MVRESLYGYIPTLMPMQLAAKRPTSMAQSRRERRASSSTLAAMFSPAVASPAADREGPDPPSVARPEAEPFFDLLSIV